MFFYPIFFSRKLKKALIILAVSWLIFIGIFLYIENREKAFRESLKVSFEQPPADKNTKETKIEKPFDPRNLKWRPVSLNASFAERDAHTLTVFKNKLWIFGGVGGASPDYTKNFSDIWSSENGKDWIQVTDKATWGKKRAHDSVVFKDKIWILGGVTTGEKYLNDVWSSEDGINWIEVTKNASWASRKGFATVVFDNKLWVIGGVSINGPESDVWYSEDGKDWIQVTNNAGWKQRYDLAAEVFLGKIWLTGGIFPGETLGEKDVWVSENGKDWTLISKENIWPGRHGHCFLSFNNYLFIIGGWSGHGHGYNDVWYSKDGIEWSELYKDNSSPWLGREDLTCANFNNKIFMLGGMETSGQRTNDIWALSE